MKHKREIFMVAGEASADLHGAKLLSELKTRFADLACFGVGGENLRGAGMEVSLDASALNVVGISDWMHKVPDVLRSYWSLKKLVSQRKPSCAILIDLPDFNLRMAKHLKSLNIPVIYYISPQVWAWRKYRIHQIRARVDKMLVVFPFEKKFYDENGVDVTFVGHPLLEERVPREGSRTQSEILKSPRVALLPGSRTSEIRYHLPVILELRDLLIKKYPQIEFRIPIAPTLPYEEISSALKANHTQCVRGGAEEVLKASDIALVASGTATLETALTGTPFALFYRLSPSSAFIFQKVARYKGFLGMPNLLHGREVVKEFFQEQATAESLAGELSKLIDNEAYRNGIAQQLVECRGMLGTSGATARAASEVERFIRNSVRENGVEYKHSPVTA